VDAIDVHRVAMTKVIGSLKLYGSTQLKRNLLRSKTKLDLFEEVEAVIRHR